MVNGDIGTVVLDKLSVDKILSRFQFSLVKFDTFYPTGIENGRYVEYRAVSGVFQNIDPPPSPPSECVLPPHQMRGVGVNIL
jgi:hypothetical protein